MFGSTVRWFHDPGVPSEDASHTWRSLARRALAASVGTLARTPETLALKFAVLDSPGIFVGSDAGRDLGVGRRHVHGNDLDARGLGLGDGSHHTLAVHRRDHDDIDALDDEVLDIGQLLVQVLVGDADFQRPALGPVSFNDLTLPTIVRAEI